MITLFCIRPKGFNIGNDVIFLGMQHFLQEAFGQIVNLIPLPATSRYESQSKAGLTPSVIYEINQYGHGVIVGGGNIYENGELEVNLDALETLEAPLMLYSLSRGRVYNCQKKLVDRTDSMPARVASALNHKAKYSLARDNITGAYLRSIGCEHSEVGGCPTLFLNRIAEYLPQLHEQDRGGVLISIRNPSLMNIPLQKQSQMHSNIPRIIELLRDEGFNNIRLLCHDHRDIPFAASFTGIDYIYTSDVHTYLSLLHSCTLNISYRLHSFIPCLSFGTPTISISYDERALSLIETIGLEAWNIDMINSDDVIGQVADRCKRLKDLDKLREQAKPAWDQIYLINATTFHNFASDVLAYYDQAWSNR